MVFDLEKDLEKYLCKFPELIDDSLRQFAQGLEAVRPDGPFMVRQDSLPNKKIADIVFVEPQRITVVELKKGSLKVSHELNAWDVVDQIENYLEQCTHKYPGRAEYRGFIIGTYNPDHENLDAKLGSLRFPVTSLVVGPDIPRYVTECPICDRAKGLHADHCVCQTIHKQLR